MPGLIQRHNAVAEYSALMSTNPSATQRRHRRQAGDAPSRSSARTAISDEAADWYEAICPPLEDLQAVIRRMQADPDMSQERIFGQTYPIVALGTVFAIAVVAVQEHSFAHRILDATENYWQEVGMLAAIVVGGVALSVISLKGLIFAFAEVCSFIMSIEAREAREKKEEKGVPSSGMVLNGMFL